MNPGSVQAVLFDLDGTLYSQRILRTYLALELLRYTVTHPTRAYELAILRAFRSERERHAGTRSPLLDQEQYEWAAVRSGYPPETVRAVVEEWIYTRPLPYLRRAKPKALDTCLNALHSRGIKVGVCSDFPTTDKLRALAVVPDTARSATDQSVCALKPDPTIFIRAAEALGVPPGACLVVGDRVDRDGVAAERAGMQFMHATANDTFYTALTKKFE